MCEIASERIMDSGKSNSTIHNFTYTDCPTEVGWIARLFGNKIKNLRRSQIWIFLNRAEWIQSYKLNPLRWILHRKLDPSNGFNKLLVHCVGLVMNKKWWLLQTFVATSHGTSATFHKFWVESVNLEISPFFDPFVSRRRSIVNSSNLYPFLFKLLWQPLMIQVQLFTSFGSNRSTLKFRPFLSLLQYSQCNIVNAI